MCAILAFAVALIPVGSTIQRADNLLVSFCCGLNIRRCILEGLLVFLSQLKDSYGNQ